MARPKGSKDKRVRTTAARKQAQIASSRGLTALEMMQATAQMAWDIADKMASDGKPDIDVLAMRQIASKEAAGFAPYTHAKLASEVHRVINDDSQRSQEDIERELADLERRGAAAGASKGTVETGVPPKSNGMVH